MCTSWFFATFFFQALLHILGPSAFSADSIPEDSCCGQRIKQKRKKKKQRETWQPKVVLKDQLEENGTQNGAQAEDGLQETATMQEKQNPQQQIYLPTTTSSPITTQNHHEFLLNEVMQQQSTTSRVHRSRPSTTESSLHSMQGIRNGTNMKTFATTVSVESALTQISGSSNTVDNVVTTIAAQINPPESSGEAMMSSSISVNEDVFKSSNLNEEDLQDGRVTLPMTKGYSFANHYLRQSPSPPPPPLETPSPLPSQMDDSQPSAPYPDITEIPSSTKEKKIDKPKQIFETALIHSDSPTIRADPMASTTKRHQMLDSLPKKKVKRSGSSGTVIEFIQPIQMETIEIDLTTPVPKQSIVVSQNIVTSASNNMDQPQFPNFASAQVIQPAIRSIIKTKKTSMGAHHNAYHGYFYLEEHPPPAPPHAYELQQQTYQPQSIVTYPADLQAYCPPPPPKYQPEPTPAITCDEQHQQSINNVPVPLPRSFDIVPYNEPMPPPPPPHQNLQTTQQEEVVESVAASRRRRRSKTKSMMPSEVSEGELVVQIQQQQQQSMPLPTEEEVISHVMSRARQNRSKSCHERSNSMKKYTKRKLAPDEDLITVVTDDHLALQHNNCANNTSNLDTTPKPKPRKSLSRSSRSGSASLGNILAVNPDQFLIQDLGEVYISDKADRQTLPRLPRRQQHTDLPTPSPQQPEIYYVEEQCPSKTTPRKSNNHSSYHNRHPLSLSTETILFNDDKYDPNPIVPNRAPDVPDIWLPMRSVKA